MNLIIELSSSKCENVIYDAILTIVDKCTKTIKYWSVIIKIDIAKLMKLFFEKIVFCFDMLADIVNNKVLYSLILFDQRFAIMQRLNVD